MPLCLSSRGDGAMLTLTATKPKHHTLDPRQKQRGLKEKAKPKKKKKVTQRTSIAHEAGVYKWKKARCAIIQSAWAMPLPVMPAQWTHNMQQSSLAATGNYHNECKKPRRADATAKNSGHAYATPQRGLLTS